MTRIETILPELGADPIDDLLTHPLVIEDGDILAPDVPGAGTALDWAAITRFATRKEILSQ